MTCIAKILPLGLALAALCAAPALAQDTVKKSSPLPDHLPVGTEACFGRVYDAAHLKQHPKQRVTRFHLFRDFSIDKNAEEPPLSAGSFKDSDGEDGRIGVSAFVSFRDKPGPFTNWLSCIRYDSGDIRCGIDCDGGSFKLRANGKSLLLDNEGFVVVGGCGASDQDQENSEYVRPGTDDKTFRLDPMPVAACAAVRDQMKPSWAKLGPPVRERLARPEAVCFTRSYDAAHLAKNPRQTVRRIAVLKADGVKAESEEIPAYKLTFRVEFKNGRKAEKTTMCTPSKYSYACTHDPKMDTSEDFFLSRAGDRDIMLRDRQGKLADLFDVKFGPDDRIFRLPAEAASACEF